MKPTNYRQVCAPHAQRQHIASFILFFLFLPPVCHSQHIGDVEGMLINRTDPAIIPRAIEIDVIGLGEGMSVLRSARTDSAGRFRIEGLPVDRRLMIRANYQSANYHGPVSFNAEGKAYVEIEVFECTASMKDIQVESVYMAFQMDGDQLKSLERISLNNKTHPPRTFMNPEGNFRFSKPPGILETPLIRVTAPSSSMPLVQEALESPDGQSYYSLYPLKPGLTTFEIKQALPYKNRRYAYAKKYYQDVAAIDIGVAPGDMVLSGEGLSRIQSRSQDNISVYVSSPVKAGSELVWNFSGGTPVMEPEISEVTGQSEVRAVPGPVGRNAFVIGPLILMAFMLALWFAINRAAAGSSQTSDSRTRQLQEFREQLLNQVAELDHRYEIKALDRQEYLRQREESKRRLRRVFQLLKKP